MEIPNTAESEEVFSETFAKVEKALEDVGSCSGSNTQGDSHYKEMDSERVIFSLKKC